MEWQYAALFVLIIVVAVASAQDSAARTARIERKLNLLIRHAGIDPLQGLPLSERVKEIASDPARKIEAIKLYREESGASLKEAKDAVEAFINSK